MNAEAVERRVLGAVRFVDGVTRLRVNAPLRVTPPAGLRGARNLEGLWVLTGAPGQGDVTAAVAEPAYDPADAEDVEFSVEDPSGEYLACRFHVRLPRDPRPANAEQPNSLFRPVEVSLYPSPAARVAPGWAVVRMTVQGATPGSTAPGALVRALRAGDGTAISSGLADARGEVLVAVPGIPVTTWSAAPGDGVTTSTLDVSLQVVWNEEDAEAGRLPDPAALETAPEGQVLRTLPVTLSAGQHVVLRP